MRTAASALIIAFVAVMAAVIVFAVVDRDVPTELWGLAAVLAGGIAGASQAIRAPGAGAP